MATPSTPGRSIGFLIVDVSRLLRRSFNRRAQTLGLTEAQWRLIANLARSEGMNQAALAECLDVKPITLARLIDRMEAAGWVERRNDPKDRRASQIYLTPKSEPILAEMRGRAAELLEVALDGLSAAERKRLGDALHLVKQNLLAAEAAAEQKPDGTERDVRAKKRAGFARVR